MYYWKILTSILTAAGLLLFLLYIESKSAYEKKLNRCEQEIRILNQANGDE